MLLWSEIRENVSVDVFGCHRQVEVFPFIDMTAPPTVLVNVFEKATKTKTSQSLLG